MESVRLGNLVDFKAGLNQSRVADDLPDAYSNKDFMYDMAAGQTANNEPRSLNQKPLITQAGDVIFDRFANKMAVVSPKNAGKVVTLGFAMVSVKDDRKQKIDMQYLINCFNYGRNIRKQLYRLQQGEFIRISLTDISYSINLPLIPYEQQAKISTVLQQVHHLQKLTKKKEQLLDEFIKTVINQ